MENLSNLENQEKPKSQVEVDQNIIEFLGDLKIETPDDLVALRELLQTTLESKPYNDETKEHADSIQWKRTASEIIKDGYVYEGKSCSDLVLVFLAACKVKGIEGQLVKLVTVASDNSHSIVEVKLADDWYRLDPSMPGFPPKKGQLTTEMIQKNHKDWKIWKKGKDLWELGLKGIEDEEKVCE